MLSAPRYFAPRYFAPRYWAGQVGAVVVVPPAEKSDRAAIRAIVAILRATNRFDKVTSGRLAADTPMPAKVDRWAHVEPIGEPRARADESPHMELNVGEYRLTIVLRSRDKDEAAYSRIDRLKDIARNALTDPDAKAYGGFCLPWYSLLRAGSMPSDIEPGLKVELRGQYGYYIDQYSGFSEVS